MKFRAEYVKLGSDLPRLARDFGLDLEVETCRDTLILALAMDTIDDRIDSFTERTRREQVYATVLQALEGLETPSPHEPEEFRFCLACIHQAARRQGVEQAFREQVAALIRVGEELRTADHPAEFVRLSRREADITVEMLYLILGPRPERFRRFLHRTGVVGNLADKLLDLAEDRREGRTVVSASPALVAGMLREILPAAWEIPWLHPRPLRLLGYAWSYFLFGLGYLTGVRARFSELSPTMLGGPDGCESLRERSAG